MADIKTTIFDLGGVYFTDGTAEAIRIISQKYGVSEEQASQIFKGDVGTEYRKGIITHDEFWAKAKELWNIPDVSINELAQIWLNGYRPIKGTVEIIQGLKKAGYELLFLSDNVQERVDYLEETYGFLDNFKDGVFSHLVNVRKPNPEIYKLALNKSSNSAENCVYVDDKSDLLPPATELGMETIHFTSPEELEKSLIALGVNWDREIDVR